MRKAQQVVRALGFTLWSALVATLVPVSAEAQSLNIKPGAWENTVTVSGLAIPPEVLEKMPPDRRAMVEQQLRGGGQPRIHKRCVTKDDLDKGFSPNPNASCKIDVVSRTATRMSMNTTCTSPEPSTGTMTWEAKTPELVTGKIDQDVRGRKVHIDVLGKWLGASCEGIGAS